MKDGRARVLPAVLLLAAACGAPGGGEPATAPFRPGARPILREWTVRLPHRDPVIEGAVLGRDADGQIAVFAVRGRADWDHLRSLDTAARVMAGAAPDEADRSTVVGVLRIGQSSPPSLARIVSVREEADRVFLGIRDWEQPAQVGTTDILVRAHVVALPRMDKPVRYFIQRGDLRAEYEKLLVESPSWRK